LIEALNDRVKHTTAQIGEELAKQKVTLGGMITETRRITTKKGDTMHYTPEIRAKLAGILKDMGEIKVDVVER
jgi:hypothetical protein